MKRDLILLSALAAAAFAILAGLGIWQLQRLEWKEGLIARIEARTRAAPVPLAQVEEKRTSSGDIEFLRVGLEGRYMHARERHLYALVKGEAGWRVITPMELPSGSTVMVDRGFVPQDLKDPANRPMGQVEGDARITGLVRLPEEPGLFTPDNAPEKNIWHWRDLQGMAASVLAPGQMDRLAPYFVQLDAPAPPSGWPKPAPADPNLPNRHFEYALTWFGLAGGLLAVFAIYLRGRLRRGPLT